MGNFVIILIVIIIGVVVYKSTQNKDDSSVILTSLDTDHDPDDYGEISDEFRKNMEEWWKIKFYGGDEFDDITGKKIERFDGKGGVWEGYNKYFRKYVCSSREIISDEEVIEIHQQYQEEIHPLTNEGTRLIEVNKIKRFIHDKMCVPLKSDKYDPDTKSWTDFDVTGVIMRVRGHMINTTNPFPHYVWNIVPGNPFDRIYRICRDYTKWKGTLRTSKTLFDNVCKWENGEIFREGEPNKEFEIPLWVNWNVVGKVFLSFKTKLKKDSPEGLEWLKETVGGYIRERKEFYDQFGEDSEYYISDELLEKYSNLK